MTWRLRGARLWAGMAWGARRMQKVLDGDPTHAIGLEGRLASSIRVVCVERLNVHEVGQQKATHAMRRLARMYRGQA